MYKRQGPHLASNWPGWRYMAPYVLLAALAGYMLGFNLGLLLLGLSLPTPMPVGGGPVSYTHLTLPTRDLV